MDDTTKEIIGKLKDCEQQGLSYYQAKQQLLKAGYTQLQIDDAEDEFHYTESVPESDTGSHAQGRKSIDESYEKVGQVLIKDTKKRRKPNILLKSYTSNSGFFYGAITGRVWIAIIISLLLTFYFGQVYHVTVDNARYCNDTPIIYTGPHDPSNSAYCAKASANVYGWPIRGQTVHYTVQGSGTFYSSSRGIETFNLGFFFIIIYIALRLFSHLLNRWHS